MKCVQRASPDAWLSSERATEKLWILMEFYNGMKMNPRCHFQGDFACYLYSVDAEASGREIP